MPKPARFQLLNGLKAIFEQTRRYIYTKKLHDSFNLVQPVKQSALASRNGSISKHLIHNISM